MKVCQLCAVDFTVEKFLIPLIDAMETTGWQVTVVCSDGPSIPSLSKKGYRFRTINISRSIHPIKAIKSILALFKLFREEQFDVIHVHTPVAALLSRIAAVLACKSFVIYTAHGFYFHDEMPLLKRNFFLFLEKFSGKFTDYLFCQSREDAEVAIKESIMPEKSILVIGNGVDVFKFNPSLFSESIIENRKLLGIPKDACVVGIIARMVKDKGYYELLEAAINISKSNHNFYLLIIGGKLASDHEQSIDPIINLARLKMGHKLIEVGFRSDTPMLLSLMDIFCLPSYREGLPRTIIEAMMMAKPVIATNIRGCRELVIPDVTGILIPSKNTIKLIQAINKLINDKELRLKMGQIAREIALKNFDESEVIKLQIDVVKKLIKSNERK